MTQAGVYSALAVLAFTIGVCAPVLPGAAFSTYFGPLPAWLAIALVAGAGLAAGARLRTVGWAPAMGPSANELSRALALGAAFALPTVALDIALPFAADINAPLPDALAFYPAIGFVAETVFHLVPFAILSLLVPRRAGPAIVACACIEPLFQVSAGGGLDLRNTLMAMILFGFGLVQMRWLHDRGFVAAFALRLGYYAVWHIGWGTARGPLLFGS